VTLQYLPLDVSQVTDALVNQIRAWPGCVNTNVSRAQELNKEPSQCPWVGVYRDRVNYVPKVVGLGTGAQEQQMYLVVVVQESHPTSGEQCENALERLVREVMRAILNDMRLTVDGSGLIRNMADLSVQYSDYRIVGGIYMQTAAIYLTAVDAVRMEDIP
jgi:hypothetical protein